MNKEAVLIPQHVFGARKVAGSATYKQSDIVKLCDPYSIMNTKTVCLFSLCGLKKKLNIS